MKGSKGRRGLREGRGREGDEGGIGREWGGRGREAGRE